jgi:CDP-paratose 2-epimerase
MIQGEKVIGIDDFSRPGVRQNADYLYREFGFIIDEVDVAEREPLWNLLRISGDVFAIIHLAGQVSFLGSITDPWRDFRTNAIGTLNLLEFVRLHSPETRLIAMSSNKVYGDLAKVRTFELETRYIAPDWPNGFDESLPLDLHGPYGCSKGIVDQYTSDYARTFGLNCYSFRQSTIYGPFQHPQADQGWVGHILEEAMKKKTVKLNGIGKQVRDILHVKDLTELIEQVATSPRPLEHHSFNVGGGASNSLSILELFTMIKDLTGIAVDYAVGERRPSDQNVFISDNSRIQKAIGWKPTIEPRTGVSNLLGLI